MKKQIITLTVAALTLSSCGIYTQYKPATEVPDNLYGEEVAVADTVDNIGNLSWQEIFITGKVREFDSTNPKDFTDGIEEYIKNNIVDESLADMIKVNASETATNEITIDMSFGGNEGLGSDDITREMYRCFTGEYKGFVAENTIWWMAGFGPDYGMNVMFSATNPL